MLLTEALPDVTIENGRLSVAPIRKVTPDEALALAGLLYGMLPRVKVTELLQEVDGWTKFTDQFVHLRTGLPPEDKEAILSAVLADGINLGLARMADACKTVSLRRLAWTADWHIRDECYSQALAQVIDVQHDHPFSRHWGEGTTSSSDGQHYRARGRGEASSQVNARYGNDPGVMFYTPMRKALPTCTRIGAGTVAMSGWADAGSGTGTKVTQDAPSLAAAVSKRFRQ